MPPKPRITRDDILNTALDIVRTEGEEALNARHIAAVLQCSTQPVFSNFSTMEELRQAVIDAAYRRYRACLRREQESGRYPAYKASGMGYIHFAREEKELFRLLFMRDRSREESPAASDEITEMAAAVQELTGLSSDDAQLFHLEMWVYVHGIASMLATSYLEWDEAMISRILTDAYLGLKKRYSEKESSSWT